MLWGYWSFVVTVCVRVCVPSSGVQQGGPDLHWGGEPTGSQTSQCRHQVSCVCVNWTVRVVDVGHAVPPSLRTPMLSTLICFCFLAVEWSWIWIICWRHYGNIWLWSASTPRREEVHTHTHLIHEHWLQSESARILVGSHLRDKGAGRSIRDPNDLLDNRLV